MKIAAFIHSELKRIEKMKYDALKYAGSKQGLAGLLGICRQTVSAWFTKGCHLSHVNVIRLEQLLKELKLKK